MNPFLRHTSFLLVFVILAGCGQGRTSTLPGHPYPVTLAVGVMIAPEPPPPSRVSSNGGGGSGGGSCNFNLSNCGSGKDALVGLVVVIAVVIVVAVVVCAVDAAKHHSEDRAVEQYYLTLSGDGVPMTVAPISTHHYLYLEQQQYDALVQGTYTRAVLRPAFWEYGQNQPTQDVRLTVERGHITIAPRDPLLMPATP